ncbi:MAG: ribonuclease D [Planctomycetia bacterium]|nr:ribonuclease D [Planctomycetia bacterium]
MTEPTQEIITSAVQLVELCREWSDCPVIGFDTEFVGEHTYHPELCLVQVALPNRLYLIDPYSTGPLDPFWRLLHDPQRVAVVHAGREEVRLCRVLSGAPPANLFDIQLAAGLINGAYPLGHAAVVQQYLGHRLSKGETLTEWRRRPLTPAQVRYAFDDVRYLLRLYEKQRNHLKTLNRLEWVKEEAERLIRRAGCPEVQAEEERWRKLRGIGSLDRRKLAVVKGLYELRDAKAIAADRPARTILRDDLLVEIAKRTPKTTKDLEVIRGLAARDLPDVLQTVEAAYALPLEKCPSPPEREVDFPQLPLITNILIAVLGDYCARHHLAMSLVASTSDIRTLTRAAIMGNAIPEMPLTQGWRARNVLPELLAVLAGRKQFRLANIRSETPLELQPTVRVTGN